MHLPAAATLPELLLARATLPATANAEIGFLDEEGNVANAITYADLLRDATNYAATLLAAGLRTDGSDIVLASFKDHESHTRLFWACCIARIPFCPLPAWHPDPSSNKKLLIHLQTLLETPTLISSQKTIDDVRSLVPDFKAISVESLKTVADAPNELAGELFPSHAPKSEDVACLMLTSGSTGNSKAVVLTHSNLLSSVRGKIKHHNTTAASRFLNWIAFDHVACLSEIHIHALEAGARTEKINSQYHVAPETIIRTPKNLIEWCSRLAITNSFSPNFLMAQICRDVATSPLAYPLDLSRMRVFVSGGEAVPLSTAIWFADIIEGFGAPRDVLRSGFGLTETGGGCIYDARPIVRSTESALSSNATTYLPIGISSEGNVARIADPITGEECAPFIEGQLQLHGPTVFSRYYNNFEATQSAFTPDGYFITGDLACKDQDGFISLRGRDKDCVNINGIKHPTTDVEAYIEEAGISAVQHSYLYVCPMRLKDADTETYGVFYQHRDVLVEEPMNEAQKDAVRATDRAIKNACTTFCYRSPHVVLALPRKYFTKTALGKVSRSRLSKAYFNGDFASLEGDLAPSLAIPNGHSISIDDSLDTPIGIIVGDAVAAIFSLNSSKLRRSENLFDVGATSMQIIQLKSILERELKLNTIATIEILKRPGLGQLVDYITDLVAQSSAETTKQRAAYNPLVCFQDAGSKPPLFLVHPGVGEVLVFINVAHLLDDDRPVYALRARGFDYDEITFPEFRDMADTYVDAIEKQYPSGPYFIAGYSLGGAIAYEMVLKLEERGKRVDWLGILNLPPHIQFRMGELVWVEILMNLGMFLSLVSPNDTTALKSELLDAFPDVAAQETEPVDAQAPIKWFFERSDQARLAALDLEIGAFARWVKVAYEINRTGRSFVPEKRVQGALTTVFCAVPLPSMGSREEYKEQRLSQWEDYAGEHFELVDVDGEHYTMLSEGHVHTFAKHLKGALHRAEQFGNSSG